jgi:signal transduction histidine kinase/Tfp pilus assembly protein PilF
MKTRKQWIIIVLFLFPFIVNGQQALVDSLKNRLSENLSDTDRLETLTRISYQLFNTDQEASMRYSEEQISLAQEIGSEYWLARAYNNLAINYQIRGDFKKADSLYNGALETFIKEKDSLWISNVYNNLGILASYRGRFNKAITYHFKNLEIKAAFNDSLGIARALNKIGMEFTNSGDLVKARDYFNQSLEIQEKYQDNIDYPFLLMNLGHCLFVLGNQTQGMNYIRDAEKHFTETDDILGLLQLNQYLSEINILRSDFSQAHKNLDNALDLAMELNSKRAIAEIRLAKAQLLYDTNYSQEAIPLIDSVLMSSYMIGATDLELEALMLQAGIRGELFQHYNRAILYKRYIHLSDSLSEVEKLENLAEAENAYLLEQNNKKLALYEEREKINLERAKRIRIIGGMLALLILSIAIYSIVLHRRSRTIKRLNSELTRQQEDLEKIVQERTVELENAIQHVVESDKLKSYFLANLSHEIRTPLNSILGFSDVLLDAEIEGEDLKYVEEINKSGEQLLSIIDRILKLSKLQAGSIKTYPGIFEPRSKLQQLEITFREIKKEFDTPVKLKLDMEIRSKSPVLINSDQELIGEVLLNLVHNAFKFCHEGSIRYGMIEHENEVEFFVEDQGIGIKTEDIPKIFTPFDQVEDVLTKTHRGVGLGLPLSAQIMYLLESKLQVESVYGQGSRFFFRIRKYQTGNQ